MCCWRKKRVKKKDENTAPTNPATQPTTAAPSAAATAPSASAKNSQAKPADGKQLQIRRPQPTPSDTYKRALHGAGKCSVDPTQAKAKPKEAEANKGKAAIRLPTKRTPSVDPVIPVPKHTGSIRHGPLVGPTPPALPPPGPQPSVAAPKCDVRVQPISTATVADATQPSTTTEVDPRKNSTTDVSGKELEDEKTEETIQAAVIPSAPNTYAHASEPHFREVAVDRLPVQEHDEDRILRPIGPAVNLDMRPAAAVRSAPHASSKNQSTLEEVDGDMESQDFEDAEPVSDRSAFRR